MPSQRKIEKVKELTAKIKEAKVIVFANYKGVTVAEDTELRRKFREVNVEYLVAKNRLFKIALKEAGIEDDFSEELKGATSFAFGYEDTVNAPKVLYEFGEDKDILDIKAGYLEGEKVAKEKVETLAKLPTKEELLSKMVSSLQAPLSGLVNVLQGPTRNLAYALKAIKDEKN
ncbi:MAG: 50S ribosomal protein L10 [Fusobacteriota bacterium]